MINIIHAKLLAAREDSYTIYVFRNLDTGEFVMCTKPPNWQTSSIKIGEVGFLKYEEVKAGQEYYNPQTDEKVKYHYSNVYFLNFIKEGTISNDSNIIL